MFVFILRRCVLSIFIFSLALVTKAQQIHFIYLQTENAKPFYVKLDNKVVSSSVNGYLIIPKLIDGDYNITVGFPKKEFPEENYQVTINKKDEGFLLKNFDEKGWGLFDMQSYAVTMGGNKSNSEVASKNVQSDPFSKMLANVVKDSSILQKNEPAEEVALPHKTDTTTLVTQAPANADTTVAIKQVAKLDPTITDTTATIKQVAKSDLQPTFLSPATKISGKKGKDGIEMIYVDHNMDKDDTVRVFVPAEKEITKGDTVVNNVIAQKENVEKENESAVKPAAKVDTTVTTSPVASDKITVPENKDTVVKMEDEVKPTAIIVKKDSVVKQENSLGDTAKYKMVVLPKVVKISTTNSDCKAFAADEDFLKLRKKMAAENSNDAMIKIAKKVFHSKCFSTEQIKNLSFLFLTNEGKYMFFDAAYPFVSDSDEYPSLQSQITDSYYLNRFKAMINK